MNDSPANEASPRSSRFGWARRGVAVLSGVALAFTVLLAGGGPSSASQRPSSWVSTWGTGVTGVPAREPGYPDGRIASLDDQTLRQVVHTSVGGRALALRLSNEHGTEPLRIGEVRVAVRQGTSGTAIDPATDRVVTFAGDEAVTIPAGAPYRSDPVDLDVPADADLVISMYVPERTPVTTAHCYAMQVNEIAAGNVTGARTVEPVAETAQWLFLSGVDVVRDRPRSAAVVVLGASLSDGVGTSEGANRRWPDLLSDRMRDDRRTPDLGVVNAGIAGNRLLHDPNPPAGQQAEAYAAYFGPSGLRRFGTDVLERAGAEYVIVDLGTNDLAQPSAGSAVPEETVTAAQIIAGHRQLVARAHAHGLKAYGATIAPFKGAKFGFWTEAIEIERQAVNHWIRTSGVYDGVIDIDAAVRDAADPLRLNPGYDAGDHIHLNDAGPAAVADAVPLSLFR
jgi:lysophospholipase L1-like esterase